MIRSAAAACSYASPVSWGGWAQVPATWIWSPTLTAREYP